MLFLGMQMVGHGREVVEALLLRHDVQRHTLQVGQDVWLAIMLLGGEWHIDKGVLLCLFVQP